MHEAYPRLSKVESQVALRQAFRGFSRLKFKFAAVAGA